MNSKQLYLVLIAGIGVLALALVGGAYGANTLLSTRANKLTELKATYAAQSDQQLSLTKAKSDIVKYQSLNDIAKSIVPEDKDQAEAVREIVNIANRTGVTLSAINFNASTLGNGVKKQSSATTTTTTPSAAANDKTSALSQLQPVPNIKGVYILPITVVGDTANPVKYDQFINFLSSLEQNRRTAQVSTITIIPNSNNRSLLSFTLGLNEYIKP